MGLEHYNLESFRELEPSMRFYREFELDRAFVAPLPDTSGIQSIRPEAVASDVVEPYAPDPRDLSRLYWLTRSRRVTNVVELGSGYSTAVLALALADNSLESPDWFGSSRRREKLFTLTSLEESARWADVTRSRVNPLLLDFVSIQIPEVVMGNWEGRRCSFFSFPLRPADLIYVDGPSQFAATPAADGWNVDSAELMPMSADLLPIEHFFEPGAIILFDGRAANARFMSSNLQRNWALLHDLDADVTLFELHEAPLGPISAQRLELLDSFLLSQHQFTKGGQIPE